MLMFTCIDQSFTAVLYSVLRTKMLLNCFISAVHTFCDDIFNVLTEIYFDLFSYGVVSIITF